MTSPVILEAIIDAVYVKEQARIAHGVPQQPWLTKQIAGIHLATTDPKAGLTMLIDGLQDERDALDKAQYKLYPGGSNGTTGTMQS